MTDFTKYVLDRLEPTDWEHVDKYPAIRTLPQTVANVEHLIPLRYQYRPRYDQGYEGACVGFSLSWMMSLLNKKFYDAQWLYLEAQKVDEWPGENYEGTSVRAGMDILRNVGHKEIHDPRHNHGILLGDGIAVNRWATTVDQIRTSISLGVPVVVGSNWYENFYEPVKVGRDYWIGEGNLGRIFGGHAWCIYGASDKRQAFKFTNSWGKEYPLTWIPYETVQRLLNENGEATLATDR